MRNYGIVFLLLFIFSVKTWAQPSQPATPTTIPFFYEKAYIHTDRDVYIQGDDLWFKAYLVDAQNNKPIGYSRNLYVELISPASQITLRHVLRMENGLGNADFKLPDTLSAGTYRIRAYTNWMRNFGDNFIFEKLITVFDKAGKQTTVAVQPIKYSRERDPATPKMDVLEPTPSVQFFPESGSLVNGVRSTVAVKIENLSGKNRAINGDIVASSGRVVAKFKCDSLGFGSFEIEPDETQDYQAVTTIGERRYTFKLPAAKHTGFVLSAAANAEGIATEILCNGFSLNDYAGTQLIITVRHGANVYYKERLPIQTTAAFVEIPDDKISEGVACITLYDQYNKPLAERLLYIHHDDGISIGTDRQTYKPKQQVTVKIKLADTTTKAHLSLSAVDVGISPLKPENIVSYLTLRSETRGTIEHAERYFDTTNVNRFAELDLLLLTQGWRDFIWKNIADNKFKQRYDVEQALTITGHVRHVWGNAPLSDINITMFAPKAKGDKLFHTLTDSLGNFRLDGVNLVGYNYVKLNSRRSDGVKFDGSSLRQTGGWIIVDSLSLDKPPIEPLYFADTVAINIDSLYERERAKQKFSFTGVNLLKTVKIQSYSNALPPEIHPVTMVEQKKYKSVADYVVDLVPGAGFSENGVEIDNLGVGIWGKYSDNSPIVEARMAPRPEPYEFWGLPMDKVLKVTINSAMTPFGKVYSVFLLMRPNALKVKDNFDNTMADLVGYTEPRVFYAPKYDAPSDAPDYRTTLHWEPNITTDAKGEATVTFYNADPRSKIMVVVQGVTDKGVPLAATAVYKVQ